MTDDNFLPETESAVDEVTQLKQQLADMQKGRAQQVVQMLHSLPQNCVLSPIAGGFRVLNMDVPEGQEVISSGADLLEVLYQAQAKNFGNP